VSANNVQVGGSVNQIPRYVQNLNRMAMGVGIEVCVQVLPFDGMSELRLWSDWSGTLMQLQSLGLIPPHEMHRITRPRIRGPGRDHLAVPAAFGAWQYACLWGDITVHGDRFKWEIDSGPIPTRIEDRDGLQVIHSEGEWTIFHGSFEALLAAGIDRRRLPTGQRGGRWGYDSYYTRRQPDGSIVYHLHKPEVADPVQAPRKFQSPHLRLVVDNTTPEVRS
jgi:hypothetical protein